MNNLFCSLGGGEEIGASCYFISINGNNFLFDAGIRYTQKRRYPSLSYLSNLEVIDTLNDIDVIFLSHSHNDHNGALPLLVEKFLKPKEIICSEDTKLLTENQLNIIRKHPDIEGYSILEIINIERAIEMLSSYPLEKKINKKDYSFTLYHAGHIPGAVMTLLECQGKKVLYTGDFSDIEYPMTPKYKIPNIKNIDILIVNSTRLYNKTSKDILRNTYREINRVILDTFNGENSIIEVDKLNSGLEIATFLGKSLEEGAWANKNINVYVDSYIWELFNNIDVIRENKILKSIKQVNDEINHKEKNIVVTMGKGCKLPRYKKNKIQYSLHTDLDGIKELINKTKPKEVYIVHYNKEEIKPNLFKEFKDKINIKFIINEKIYNF